MDNISLPTSPEQLMKKLRELDIPFDLYEHPAIFTVAEGDSLKGDIPGCHTRNMFLRTKKKQNFLVTLCAETLVDLKKLEELLGVKHFSFGSPDRLMEILGVQPGSVTPLSVMNADPGSITIILEEKMMAADLAAYHPLINTMTVTLTPQNLLKFMHHLGHKPQIINLDPVAP